MQQSKLELDRCILFPRSQGAADCIETRELDSRYKIDVIDLNYSQLSKLELFGFFNFSEGNEIQVKTNSFVKLSSDKVHNGIKSALEARKQTNDEEMLKLIDKFVEKASRSNELKMPIWFNT